MQALLAGTGFAAHLSVGVGVQLAGDEVIGEGKLNLNPKPGNPPQHWGSGADRGWQGQREGKLNSKP